MSKIWIGDFRCKQLQYWFTKSDISGNTFLVEESAEFSWLNAVAQKKIQANILLEQIYGNAERLIETTKGNILLFSLLLKM